MTGDIETRKARALDRLVDGWEGARSALRSGPFLFEAAMTGYVTLYVLLFMIVPDYWATVGDVISRNGDDDARALAHWCQSTLLVVGVIALILTIVSGVRYHLYGHQRMRWRRAATVSRGSFMFLLAIVQFLVVPQWPGPALVSLWLSVCSLLHETGQEIDVEERNKGHLP